MTHLTLQLLRDKRKVITVRGPDGNDLHILSEIGARSVELPKGVDPYGGEELLGMFSRGFSKYRCQQNDIAIAAAKQGHQIWTPYELSRATRCVSVCGRRPELLLEGWGLTWVIVERVDLPYLVAHTALLEWISLVLDRLESGEQIEVTEGRILRKLLFVGRHSMHNRVRTGLLNMGWGESQIDAVVGFNNDPGIARVSDHIPILQFQRNIDD
jgi:hypothetical protein